MLSYICNCQQFPSDYNICTNIMDYLETVHKALTFAKQLKVIEDSFNNRSSSVSTASAANITISAMTKYQSYSTTPFSVTNHLICKIDKNRIQSVINRLNIQNSYDTTFTEYANVHQNRYYNSRTRTNIGRTTATRLIRELKNILSTGNKLKYIKAKKLARCKCCKLIGNNNRNKKTRNINTKYCYTCKYITKIILKKIYKLLEKPNTLTTRTQHEHAVQENSSANSNEENLQNTSLNIGGDLNKTDQLTVNTNCNELCKSIVQVGGDKIIGIHHGINSKSTLSPKIKKNKDDIKKIDKENDERELIMPAKKINNGELMKSQEIMEENELETVENILKELNSNIIKPTINENSKQFKSSQQDKRNATELKVTSKNKNWIKFNSAIEQTNIIKSQKTNDCFLKATSQSIKSKVPKKRAKINNETLAINVSQMNSSQQNDEKTMYDICKKVELWKQYGTPWLNDFADLYEPESYTKPYELIYEGSRIDESIRNEKKPKENDNCIQQNLKKTWYSPDLSPINAK